MVHLNTRTYTFDPRPQYPLRISVKRYWKGPLVEGNADALTIILTHGVGFHKEQWEPFIDDLYELIESNGKFNLKDIWALDSPNHGDSAILNERELQLGNEQLFLIEDHARVLGLMLAGLGTGIDVDFKKRRLFGVGHSMGASSMILTQTFHPTPSFESIVMVETITMAKQFATFDKSKNLIDGAKARRDTWETKEEAYEAMKKRVPWKVWDDRVLRQFVDFGLRPLPTSYYPDKTGFTLKCSRTQEAACYGDLQGMHRTYNALTFVPRQIPIHMVQGTRFELVSEEAQKDVLEKAIGGLGNIASYARIQGAGHLVPQTHSRQLAGHVYGLLSSHSPTSNTPTARL